MGYSFKIGEQHAFRVKEQRRYPWPIRDRRAWYPGEDGSKRTIQLFTDDVLTKSDDGTYMKQTGIGCFGIVLQDEEVEPWGEDKHLQML